MGSERKQIFHKLVDKDHKELLHHGTDKVPMSVHKTIVPEESSVALYYHWHTDLEFFRLIDGNIRFLLDGEEYELTAGDLAIISPGSPHMAYRNCDGRITFEAIDIQMKFISSQTMDYIQNQYILPMFLGKRNVSMVLRQGENGHRDISCLMDSIIHGYEEPCFGYELMMKSNVYQLLFLRFQQMDSDQIARKEMDYQWIRSISTYVQEHYQESIGLKDMAAAVGMSDGHLCRLTQKSLQMSPLEFLNRYRISQAVIMIDNSEKKLGDIALDCGFGNNNRFTENFKRYMECTPMEYRRRLHYMKGIGKLHDNN